MSDLIRCASGLEGRMDQRGFAEAFLPAGFGRNARLERIAELLDWMPIEQLVRQVRPGVTGRPPYRALAMFRALLLQQWYGLSDPGLEEALSDRVSFRRFCGLSLEEPTPDETTLCRFRLALVEAGLGDALFAEVARQLDAAGYLVKTGTLIDASLVEAAVRRPADGTVRISVCGRAVEHYAAMALMKRSPKMTANWALAMDHSRGGIFHSFSDRFKIR